MSEIRKRRVLVVDDEAAIQRLVAALLERAEFETIMADDALHADMLLKQNPLPDIMVLDLMLPGMSGIDFLKQVRANARYENLPVVILSALADPAQIREGLAAGADRYLTKPYLANNLVKTLQEVLKSGRIKR